jgi:antitoxin YefM
MKVTTYTQIRNNFAKIMNQICEDHAPMLITRQNANPVVMMSLEDYNAIEETLYLFRSPKNAVRLMKALSDLRDKKSLKKKLIEA